MDVIETLDTQYPKCFTSRAAAAREGFACGQLWIRGIV
jgi:hypothetical protein